MDRIKSMSPSPSVGTCRVTKTEEQTLAFLSLSIGCSRVAFSRRFFPGSSEVCDYVNLDQRIPRYAPCGRNRGAYWWLRAKAALIDLIHSRIIFEVVQVDVALEHLFHRRSDALKLLLDRI